MNEFALFQIASLKVRQRRILEILRERGLSNWDGDLSAYQSEIDRTYEELARNWSERESGQTSSASNT
jgi:hypothetical protein